MTESGTPTEEIGPPPTHWEADVLLRDGRTAHIRPIRADDEQLMVEFYARVSDESKYYRFFSPMPSSRSATSAGSPTSTTATGSRW